MNPLSTAWFPGLDRSGQTEMKSVRRTQESCSFPDKRGPGSSFLLLPALNADVMAGALAAGIQGKAGKHTGPQSCHLGATRRPAATSAVRRQPAA